MSESHEKKEGSCCTPVKTCCDKKFLFGVLAGLAIAFIVYSFACGKGSMCGTAKMCPIVKPASQGAVQQ